MPSEETSQTISLDAHVITSSADYGYPIKQVKRGRRKVLLWSRYPWREVDQIGVKALPSGRFIMGKTETRCGEITVIGVCIPWAEAHVHSGRRDKTRWQEHVTYLNGLKQLFETKTWKRTIVVGDYNQRVPRKGQRAEVYQALCDTFAPQFKIATEGIIPAINTQVIDHLSHTSDFVVRQIEGWHRTSSGMKLSDHYGVCVTLSDSGG